MQEFLKSSFYIDKDHTKVQEYAKKHTKGITDEKEKAIALYLAVRDGFKYNPYRIDFEPSHLKASFLLTKDNGYCIEKAILLAAAARSVGIPARLGFAIIENHIGTARLEKLLKTKKLVFHGFTQLYIQNKWVKATPAFNKALCDKLGVDVLEFDGVNDSIFQQYSSNGSKYMEYLHDYGLFAEFPYDLFASELNSHYPTIFTKEIIEQKGILSI